MAVSLKISIILFVLGLTMLASAASVEQLSIKEPEDQLIARGHSSAPGAGLTRFLFYNARPSERQPSGAGYLGYKRSSSALDALTGVTLGKRSAPMEFLNLEPFFGRQNQMRSMPRMYDLRWAPFDAYETPVSADAI